MAKLNSIKFLLVYILFVVACKKPFVSPANNKQHNYLVIEGVINMGNNAVTTILLSRTTQLSDSIQFKAETSARVSIIAEQGGATYTLSAAAPGEYKSNALNLQLTNRYRLNIQTTDGMEYLSEFVTGKITPSIDSIGWGQRNDSTKNVDIHVSSTDPLNNTKYYRWDFTETWQYRAPYITNYGVQNGLIFLRDSSNQIYNCWKTANSTQIATASSIALSKDVISRARIHTILKDNERLGIRYTINVRQYALSAEAFTYWQILQRNTQQLGTVFDPQPSQLKGNYFNKTNPAEIVIGFLSASSITERRLFIDNKELREWNHIPNNITCNTVSTYQNPIDYRIYNYPDSTYGPYYFVTGGIVLLKYDCLDCTRKGGTNIKPAFWQ